MAEYRGSEKTKKTWMGAFDIPFWIMFVAFIMSHATRCGVERRLDMCMKNGQDYEFCRELAR